MNRIEQTNQQRLPILIIQLGHSEQYQKDVSAAEAFLNRNRQCLPASFLNDPVVLQPESLYPHFPGQLKSGRKEGFT